MNNVLIPLLYPLYNNNTLLHIIIITFILLITTRVRVKTKNWRSYKRACVKWN